jgi:peptidoglycan hydrolase CwlO-like protein
MKIEYVKQLPIFKLTKTSSKISKEIISLVSKLLELNKKLKVQKLQVDSNNTKREIDYSENKIDQLVYQLYDLTPEEIKIVDGKY